MEKKLFNDSTSRYAKFFVHSSQYNKKARAAFYGKKEFKPLFLEAFPYLTSKRVLFKKRIAKRILLAKSSRAKFSIFYNSIRKVKNIKLSYLAKRSDLVVRYKKLLYGKFTKYFVKNLF